jgi:hypothetical protein
MLGEAWKFPELEYMTEMELEPLQSSPSHMAIIIPSIFLASMAVLNVQISL